MKLPSADFESAASASSAIPARVVGLSSIAYSLVFEHLTQNGIPLGDEPTLVAFSRASSVAFPATVARLRRSTASA